MNPPAPGVFRMAVQRELERHVAVAWLSAGSRATPADERDDRDRARSEALGDLDRGLLFFGRTAVDRDDAQVRFVARHLERDVPVLPLRDGLALGAQQRRLGERSQAVAGDVVRDAEVFARGRFDLPSLVFCDGYLQRLDKHRKGIAQALGSEGGAS